MGFIDFEGKGGKEVMEVRVFENLGKWYARYVGDDRKNILAEGQTKEALIKNIVKVMKDDGFKVEEIIDIE